MNSKLFFSIIFFITLCSGCRHDGCKPKNELTTNFYIHDTTYAPLSFVWTPREYSISITQCSENPFDVTFYGLNKVPVNLYGKLVDTSFLLPSQKITPAIHPYVSGWASGTIIDNTLSFSCGFLNGFGETYYCYGAGTRQ